MKLFNPDDEPEVVKWDGKDWEILPGWNILPYFIALHAEAVLGQWGIRCQREGEVPEFVEEKAKEQWKKGNKVWAEEVILTHHKRNKDRFDAGIPVADPPEVAKAKELLAKL